MDSRCCSQFFRLTLNKFYKRIRKLTQLPLLAGFGIQSPNDAKVIFENSNIDGIIIGSAICKIICEKGPSKSEMYKNTKLYIRRMTQQKFIAYENTPAVSELS